MYFITAQIQPQHKENPQAMSGKIIGVAEEFV